MVIFMWWVVDRWSSLSQLLKFKSNIKYILYCNSNFERKFYVTCLQACIFFTRCGPTIFENSFYRANVSSSYVISRVQSVYSAMQEKISNFRKFDIFEHSIIFLSFLLLFKTVFLFSQQDSRSPTRPHQESTGKMILHIF